MAGKIVADTLEHSTAGSIATNYVVEGSAKVYSLWDMADLSGTGGTTGIDTSFNVSSMDDDGAGDFGINFTNSFSSVNYTATSATSGGARRVLTRSGTVTASAMDGLTRNDSNSNSDASGCSVTIHGDLA
jgi:hypothetical protein